MARALFAAAFASAAAAAARGPVPIAHRSAVLARAPALRRAAHVTASSSPTDVSTPPDPQKWLDDQARHPLPVTVISGFLGAGKTTLLKHVLENGEGYRVGVLVNDVAAVNVDAKLVAERTGGGGGAAAAGDGPKPSAGMEMDMVQLQNGCICCNAGDELFSALSELVSLSYMKQQRYDHVLVESSGVAEPKLVRDSFQEATELGYQVMQAVQLARMVTVVDASTFNEQLNSLQQVRERPDLLGDNGGAAAAGGAPGANAPFAPPPQADPAAHRQVVDLLVEQVETADVVVLNKLDCVTPAEADAVRALVRELNGYATVVDAVHGVVPLSAILPEGYGLAADEAAAVDSVAMSNDVMDHKAAVDLARFKEARADGPAEAASDAEHAEHAGHSHSHEHAQQADRPDACADTGEHSHEHGHADEHAHKHSHAHEHSHEHGHAHEHSHGHSAETTASERFGIGTFVYTGRRPFARAKLAGVLEALQRVQREQAAQGSLPGPGRAPDGTSDATALWAGVLRSKGFVWLEGEDKTAFYWSHARAHGSLERLGSWWAAVPRETWPAEYTESIMSDFDQPLEEGGSGAGDRRQELVFIGVGLDRDAISGALDACLVDWEPPVAEQ